MRAEHGRANISICSARLYLHIDADGTGEMSFEVLCSSLDDAFIQSGVDFNWNGPDEGDQVTGTGCGTIRDNGWLEG